jgi:hypothetical protein
MITIYGDLFHKFMKYPRKVAFLGYNHNYAINSISLSIMPRRHFSHYPTQRANVALRDESSYHPVKPNQGPCKKSLHRLNAYINGDYFLRAGLILIL